MSASEAAVARPHPAGLFVSELRMTLRRKRTYALLLGYAAVPVLLGTAIRLATSPGEAGDGPNVIGSITLNGVYLVIGSMFMLLPLFLPVGVAVVAGDSFAGEAHLGTSRYPLVAPAGRVRLLAAKLVAVFVFCAAAALAVYLSALVVGANLFPPRRMPLLRRAAYNSPHGL